MSLPAVLTRRSLPNQNSLVALQACSTSLGLRPQIYSGATRSLSKYQWIAATKSVVSRRPKKSVVTLVE